MVEMLAHVISEVTKQSGVPCYVGTQTKAEIGDDMLLKIKPIVAHLELQRSKFLLGDYLTYVDFMLFELCERVHFLTDGRLYEEAPLLQKHNQEIVTLPPIVGYIAKNQEFKTRLFNNKIARINNHPPVRVEYFEMNGRGDMLV